MRMFRWRAASHSSLTTSRPKGALQTLLAERFQLTLHHESKEMEGFALMTAKGGFKLTPVADVGNHGTSAKGDRLTATQVDIARAGSRASSCRTGIFP